MKRHQISNHLASFILMLALSVQAIMPLGFMPDVNAGGKFALVICTGTGEKTVYVDADKMPFAPDEIPSNTDDVSDCPFAPNVTASHSNHHATIPAPDFTKAPKILAAISSVPTHITAKPWQAQAPPNHA